MSNLFNLLCKLSWPRIRITTRNFYRFFFPQNHLPRTHSPFSTIVNLTHTRTTPPLHGTVAALLPSRSSPFSFHLFSIFTIGTRKSNFFSLWKVHSQSQLITAPPETFTTPIHQPIYYTLHPNRDQTINYARAFANASVFNRSPTCTALLRLRSYAITSPELHRAVKWQALIFRCTQVPLTSSNRSWTAVDADNLSTHRPSSYESHQGATLIRSTSARKVTTTTGDL